MYLLFISTPFAKTNEKQSFESEYAEYASTLNHNPHLMDQNVSDFRMISGQ